MRPISRRTFLSGAAVIASGIFPPLIAMADDAIREITDADLFGAIDLAQPGLEQVRDAAADRNYPAAYRVWGEYWQGVAAARGRFLGDGDLLMSREQAVQSLAPNREQILASAEAVLAHKINGWGDVTIQHGLVVDFNADYGRNGLYGFHYWGWSRRLINAYLLTTDVKYLDCFETLFNQWYAQRNQIHGAIPGLDVTYYELGLGLRCRPFLEFYSLAKPQSAQTHEHILKTMLGAARWLYAEESRKYRGGNWQIMGSYGLAWIGAMLPEFADASKWVALGSDRLARHMEADFFSDGCHSERVPSSYMLVAYRDPRNLAVLLADRKEYSEVLKRIKPGLQRVLQWYFAMLPPDGVIPAINDGARNVFPQALVEDAKVMFGMDLPSEVGTPGERSVSFPKSGFTAMRSSWSRDALYMLLNHGPSGGGHSHADSLSFEMHAYGQACAIDSGIGYTYDDPHHKPWYVRTRAHNVLMIDGDDLSRPDAEGRDVAWTTLPSLEFFAATHLGYLKSKGIAHRRHVAFVKPYYWIIYDTLDSKVGRSGTASALKSVADSGSATTASRTLTWNLHCPPLMRRHARGFASDAAPGLLVLPASDWTPHQSKGPASVRSIRGYQGQDYSDIDWIWFEQTIAIGAGASLGVLLFPFAQTRPQVQFQLVKQAGFAAHFSVEHPAGVDHILFGEIDSGDFSFNGGCVLMQTRGDGTSIFSAAKTLTLKIAGKSLVDSSTQRDVDGNF